MPIIIVNDTKHVNKDRSVECKTFRTFLIGTKTLYKCARYLWSGRGNIFKTEEGSKARTYVLGDLCIACIAYALVIFFPRRHKVDSNQLKAL